MKDIDHQNSDQGFNDEFEKTLVIKNFWWWIWKTLVSKEFNDEFEKHLVNKEFLMMNFKSIGNKEFNDEFEKHW